MKRKTQLFLESMNSFLNEARNPANDKVNALLRDPIKNKEEIEKMGYKVDDSGTVINPKTNRTYEYNNFGDLYAANRNRDPYDDEYGILKGGKAGKDFDAKNYLDTNRNNDEAYLYSINKHKGKRDRISKNKGKDYSKNPAENIYKYKQAVRQRDRAQGDYDKAMSTANDIKSDLDNAEKKRQEILNNARQKRVNKESSINEDSYSEYSNVVNTINSSISKLDNPEDIQELLQNIIGICRDIAEDRGLMVESSLSESSKYNTKSKEDYENEREYEAALNDDMAIIANTFEDLEYKVNIDTTVEILKSRLDEIMNDIRKNMNI